MKDLSFTVPPEYSGAQVKTFFCGRDAAYRQSCCRNAENAKMGF